MSLYSLTNEIIELDAMIENLEYIEDLEQREKSEKAIKMMIEDTAGDIEKKYENYGKYIRNIENEIDIAKAEIERIKAIKKSNENKLERLKDGLLFSLIALDKRKVETPLFKFSLRKSTSVEIEDIDKISEDFYEIIEEKKIFKVNIKKALSDGEMVDGARLVEKENLQMK